MDKRCTFSAKLGFTWDPGSASTIALRDSSVAATQTGRVSPVVGVLVHGAGFSATRPLCRPYGALPEEPDPCRRGATRHSAARVNLGRDSVQPGRASPVLIDVGSVLFCVRGVCAVGQVRSRVTVGAGGGKAT